MIFNIGDPINIIESATISGHPIVSTDNKFAALCGGAFVIPMDLIMADGSKAPTQQTVVVWDEIEEFLTDPSQMRALIFHEVGHIECGHFKECKPSDLFEGVIKNVKYEIEADEYSASKVGREAVIRMLETIQMRLPKHWVLKKYLNEEQISAVVNELEAEMTPRIAALKKNQ